MDKNNNNVLEKIHYSEDASVYNNWYAYYCQPMNSDIEEVNKLLKDAIEADKVNEIELDISLR